MEQMKNSDIAATQGVRENVDMFRVCGHHGLWPLSIKEKEDIPTLIIVARAQEYFFHLKGGIPVAMDIGSLSGMPTGAFFSFDGQTPLDNWAQE